MPKFNFDPILIRLAKYALPYKFQIVVACLWMVGVASMSSLTATLLGKITDAGFYEGGEAWAVVAAPVALLGVTLLFAVSTVMSNYILTKVSQSILVTLRTELFTKVLKWPLDQYQAHSTGLICSKFVNEANIALSGAVQAAIVLVRDSMQVVALFALLLWQNWMLTLVACVVGPIAAIILRRIRKRMRKIVAESQQAIADILSRVQESYEAEKLIKVSNTYEFETQRFDKVNETIRRTGLKQQKLTGMGTPVTQVVTMAGVAVVVAFALFEAQQGLLTVGEFITFLSAMLLLMPPLQHLAGLNATFTSVSVAAQSVFSLIDTPEETDSGTEVLQHAGGEITFSDVHMSYPDSTNEALAGISFSVAAGEHVALVGHSGSGKTTVVNLVPRFWNVSSGSVKIDGIDVRDLTLSSLRHQISVVSQDVFLFDTSIRENVTYGLTGITDEDVKAAIEAAALTEFVQTLPQGLDTRVGENGNLLSGGQKQRVSIARALLKNAPILILDEATSALDSESEQKIKVALDCLMKGRTCLMVAHRFSTIENADRIIVMDLGRIVEEGTPDALIAKNGIYAKLKALQTGGTM